MKLSLVAVAAWAIFASMPAKSGAPASIPASTGEQQRYSINWPSGLSLGEAELDGSRSRAGSAAERLSFQFMLDAAIPGFQVADRFRAESSPVFCSNEFEKTIHQGNKKTDEKTTFSSDGSAKRETKGGGRTDISTSSCPKDALTYLFFLRKELSEGRLPQEQTVYFGAPYKIKLDFGGTQQIRIGDKTLDADRLQASVRGDSADLHFEMYFLRDPARTLAMVKVPLSMGTFSMVLEK